jgi:hypothetical protein
MWWWWYYDWLDVYIYTYTQLSDIYTYKIDLICTCIRINICGCQSILRDPICIQDLFYMHTRFVLYAHKYIYIEPDGILDGWPVGLVGLDDGRLEGIPEGLDGWVVGCVDGCVDGWLLGLLDG